MFWQILLTISRYVWFLGFELYIYIYILSKQLSKQEAMNRGGGQIRGVLYNFFVVKRCLYYVMSWTSVFNDV